MAISFKSYLPTRETFLGVAMPTTIVHGRLEWPKKTNGELLVTGFLSAATGK